MGSVSVAVNERAKPAVLLTSGAQGESLFDLTLLFGWDDLLYPHHDQDFVAEGVQDELYWLSVKCGTVITTSAISTVLWHISS